MPVVAPELADRCVVVNGVAKTYAMTGWRVGWLIGPPDVVSAAINLQSHATSSVANVSQAAALAAVSGDLIAVTEMRTAFDRRRRKMLELLRAIPGVTCVEPQGAFYAFPSVAVSLGRDGGGGVAGGPAPAPSGGGGGLAPGGAKGAHRARRGLRRPRLRPPL